MLLKNLINIKICVLITEYLLTRYDIKKISNLYLILLTHMCMLLINGRETHPLLGLWLSIIYSGKFRLLVKHQHLYVKCNSIIFNNSIIISKTQLYFKG